MSGWLWYFLFFLIVLILFTASSYSVNNNYTRQKYRRRIPKENFCCGNDGRKQIIVTEDDLYV
jgi:hypothetical protein